MPGDRKLIEDFDIAARRYLQQKGTEIDDETWTSETSLAFIDHYLKELQAGTVADEVIALLAPSLGAHLGQLVLVKFNGDWEMAEDPADWRVIVRPSDKTWLRFSPTGLAACAIIGDDIEGQSSTLEIDPKFSQLFQQAIESSPPVDAQYFYSLTGRFELIAQAADILLELGVRSNGS